MSVPAALFAPRNRYARASTSRAPRSHPRAGLPIPWCAKAHEFGRETIAIPVRQALNLSSDREADNIVNVVLQSVVAVIAENIETNGFTLMLPSSASSKFPTEKARCAGFRSLAKPR